MHAVSRRNGRDPQAYSGGPYCTRWTLENGVEVHGYVPSSALAMLVEIDLSTIVGNYIIDLLVAVHDNDGEHLESLSLHSDSRSNNNIFDL